MNFLLALWLSITIAKGCLNIPNLNGWYYSLWLTLTKQMNHTYNWCNLTCLRNYQAYMDWPIHLESSINCRDVIPRKICWWRTAMAFYKTREPFTQVSLEALEKCNMHRIRCGWIQYARSIWTLLKLTLIALDLIPLYSSIFIYLHQILLSKT